MISKHKANTFRKLVNGTLEQRSYNNTQKIIIDLVAKTLVVSDVATGTVISTFTSVQSVQIKKDLLAQYSATLPPRSIAIVNKI